jgi:hypothetical protein
MNSLRRLFWPDNRISDDDLPAENDTVGVKAMRVTMPSKRLTDPDFVYTPSCKTDLREVFRAERNRINQAK